MKFGEIKKGKFLIVRVVFNLRNSSTKYRTDYFKVFLQNTVTLITTVKSFVKPVSVFEPVSTKETRSLIEKKEVRLDEQ